MAESAFMIEPLSDSMEEDIVPASQRSVGLTKSSGKRGEKGHQEGGEKERCIGRTLGVDWGMSH